MSHGDLVVTRSDGSSRTIKSFSGVYRGVNVSRFTVTAQDIPQPKK
ncbi:MAG TPA: hypothetical protein VHW72_15155 [Candidatus Angelobacter sp.]|jgi:hypothetical protein|nr:hypothetical protein [Candidatus Angelobacter sp.]